MDDTLLPYADQWAYLASLQRLPVAALEGVIQGATGGAHPLDLRFIADEDLATPWQAPSPGSKISGPLPASLTLTLAERLYVVRSELRPSARLPGVGAGPAAGAGDRLGSGG